MSLFAHTAACAGVRRATAWPRGQLRPCGETCRAAAAAVTANDNAAAAVVARLYSGNPPPSPRHRYVPILPAVLINGAEGIGTGWSTSIPNYSPRDVVANLLRLLDKDPSRLAELGETGHARPVRARNRPQNLMGPRSK